jgi:hypothetical protein
MICFLDARPGDNIHSTMISVQCPFFLQDAREKGRESLPLLHANVRNSSFRTTLIVSTATLRAAASPAPAAWCTSENSFAHRPCHFVSSLI